MTGGALGSLLAQYLHLTADERKILLVSGAASGMAAIFNAPLAAFCWRSSFCCSNGAPAA